VESGGQRAEIADRAVDRVTKAPAHGLAIEHGGLIGAHTKGIRDRRCRGTARGYIGRYATQQARRHHVVENKLNAAVPCCGTRCKVKVAAVGSRPTDFTEAADIERGQS
jgi:hypothetical protein